MRDLKLEWQKKVVYAICICASIFQMYTAAFGILEGRLQRGIHLAFLLPLVFLLFPTFKRSSKDSFSKLDLAVALVSAIPSIYLVLSNSRIVQRWEHVTPVLPAEFICGLIVIVLVVEALRRAVTPALAWVVIVALVFMKAGPYLPGMLHHAGTSWVGLVEQLYLLSDEGVYGYLLGISATYIYVFVLFGAFVVYSGAGDFFTHLACAACGRFRGGPGLVAVTSCGFFGMLSGSAVANVFATGSFTIPLMRRVGYTPEFSGAVVAAASTGGQYMPPVMGAAAFIMAEILGVSYIKIAMCASISAVLYYTALGMMVYFRARREGLVGLTEEEIPDLRVTLKSAYLLIPIVVLFYLLVKGYSPIYAGIVSIAVTIAVSWINPKKGMRPKQIVQALIDGGKNSILVAVACAGTGIIVSIVTHTGLGLSFSNILIHVSGGNIVLTMVLIALASLVIGHGAPTSATYILVATVGVGALTRLGVNPIAAHLFCLYFAVIADITPPVAVASYAGASVAKSDPLKTGFAAFALAFSGFIVPFVFVLNPAIVLQGTFIDGLWGTVTCLVGIVGLSAALQGWIVNNLGMPIRWLLAAAGLALLYPEPVSDAIGFVVLLAVLTAEVLKKKRAAIPDNGKSA